MNKKQKKLGVERCICWVISITANGSQINTVKDMKEQILEIAEKLRLELITENQAQNLLLGLFGVSGRFYTDKEIEKIKYLSFLQGTVDGDTEEDKNLEQNLDNSNEKLHISDVSDDLIRYRHKVHKILSTYAPYRIGTRYYALQNIETGEKFYDVPSHDCLPMNWD